MKVGKLNLVTCMMNVIVIMCNYKCINTVAFSASRVLTETLNTKVDILQTLNKQNVECIICWIS